MNLFLMIIVSILSILLLLLFYVAQKQRAEAKYNRLLRERLDDYLDLINATSDCIVQADLNGKITFINHSGARMFGYENPSDVYHHAVHSVPHYADPGERNQLLKDLRQKGNIENIRLRVKRVNGDIFWVQMAIHYKKDDTGNILGIEAIMRDVSDLVAHEMRLRNYSAQLEAKVEDKSQRIQELENDNFNKEKLAAVGQIASTLVHELRNPLSSIKMGMTTLSRRAELRDADRHILEVALREVSRLERIMRDILSFSRPERTDFVRANINEAIGTAMEQVAESYREQGVVLQGDLDHGVPEMRLDVNKAVQIFVNLFMNALKASELGCQVMVRTQRLPEKKCILVTVEDDGSGMAPETLAHAFEPFFSAGKDGTGLGLTVVEKFVKIHDGTVEIASKPGQGTTVTVRLPLGE
jgi:PAS domain S-box-containing protein